MDIMKRLAPGRIVAWARAGELLRKYGDVGNVSKQIFAPPLSLVRFASSTEKPSAEGKMAGVIVSDHMWFYCSVPGGLVSSVIKLDEVHC